MELLTSSIAFKGVMVSVGSIPTTSTKIEIMNKHLLILALETLREQVECGTCWEDEVDTLEGMSQLDMIDKEINLLKDYIAIEQSFK